MFLFFIENFDDGCRSIREQERVMEIHANEFPSGRSCSNNYWISTGQVSKEKRQKDKKKRQKEGPAPTITELAPDSKQVPEKSKRQKDKIGVFLIRQEQTKR